MELIVLGSESAGNNYLLKSDDQVLILEAGIRFQQVNAALGYDLSRVVGCIVTHVHQDHAKCILDYAKYGIDVYANESTINSKGDHHRFHLIVAGKMFTVGAFTIMPFLVPHGVLCYGFLIAHKDIGKLLFVTDAAYIPGKFIGLNHILIEANYSEDAMVSDRAVGHHMSLETAMQFLRSTDLSHCYNIILLHLSAGNSHEREFVAQVKTIAPHCNVMAADKGMSINLIKNPF